MLSDNAFWTHKTSVVIQARRYRLFLVLCNFIVLPWT